MRCLKCCIRPYDRGHHREVINTFSEENRLFAKNLALENIIKNSVFLFKFALS